LSVKIKGARIRRRVLIVDLKSSFFSEIKARL